MNESEIAVLVAEDNPTDAMLLRESLVDVGHIAFKVTFVETLAQCLGELAHGRFDAVLVDLGLPDSSGLDTFRSLYEYAGGTVILVLTGLEDEETGMRAVQMGAEDYLMKSQVRTSLLGRIIRYAIERHAMRKKLEETRAREAQDREVRSVELLSKPPSTAITASLYDGSSLNESLPERFAQLSERYSRLLEISMELRTYKSERTLSDDLRDLGNDLGALRASPRDVVEIHSTVLKDKLQNMSLPKAHAYLEEGRLTILELMGYVAGYYRSFYSRSMKERPSK